MPTINLQIDQDDIRRFKQKSERYDHKERCISFEKSKLFTLAFEDSRTTLEDILQTANHYGLSALFAYGYDFWANESGFKVVFFNDVPIKKPKVVRIMTEALKGIFPTSVPLDSSNTNGIFLMILTYVILIKQFLK